MQSLIQITLSVLTSAKIALIMVPYQQQFFSELSSPQKLHYYKNCF